MSRGSSLLTGMAGELKRNGQKAGAVLNPVDRLMSDYGMQTQEIPLAKLHPFKEHPFRVLDDEKMQELAESVAQHGVLVPGIARPRPEGGYELISGHRRRRASELAGKDTMPVFVRELDDDEATLLMVDSNLQREKILPSEKAFAYKMKLEAMNHQGKHRNLTSGPVGQKSSRDELADNSPDSARQIHRYIRLTYLVPALLDLVDAEKLVLRPAVEISWLTTAEQAALCEVMQRLRVMPTLEQAGRLRKYSRDGALTPAVMDAVLGEKKPAPAKVTLKNERLKQYFPQSYTQKQMEDVILSLLEDWKNRRDEEST